MSVISLHPRNHYKGRAAADVKKKRKEDKDADTRFCEYRADEVSGENKYKPQTGATDAVTAKARSIDEDFVTGTFIPLAKFAVQRRIDYEDCL